MGKKIDRQKEKRESDHKLIKELVRGNPDAFDQIFEKYYRKVYAFSLLNLRNREDAEGVVQDVFYHLWNERIKLKDLKDPESWIFSVCLNIIRKHFRRLAIERKHLIKYAENTPDSDSSTMAEVEYRDLLERTEMIIDKLPPRQRTIFLLSRDESLTNLEISMKLNISVRTVDNQLSKAKGFLKGALVEGSLLSVLFYYLFIN